MSRNTIELEFGDGQYLFALPLAQIDELQRKTGLGIGAIFKRVLKGCVQDGGKMVQLPGEAEFYAIDLVETIRQGLIGGNQATVDGKQIPVPAALANRLITNYVLNQPLAVAWNYATAILGACIMGYEPPKKGQPAAARATRKSRKGGSTTDGC